MNCTDTASGKDGVWQVPPDVPDALAAWVFVLGVGELALRRAEEAGALQFGATVGIVGLGMVGLSSLAYCNSYGFRSVCVDPDPARRAMAELLGADLVVDPTVPGYREIVQDFCGGDSASVLRKEGEVNLPGPDVVLEGASKWDAIKTSMDLCAPNGAVVVVARHYDVPQFNPVGQVRTSMRMTQIHANRATHGNSNDRCNSAHCFTYVDTDVFCNTYRDTLASDFSY